MKIASTLGLFASTVLFACAPVASSVPKMAVTSPRTADSITDNRKGLDLRIDRTKTEVVDSEDASSEKARLKSEGYSVPDDLVFSARDRDNSKISELLELRSARDLGLSAGLNRVDIVLVLIMKDGAKPVPANTGDVLDVTWSRNDRNVFSFDVSADGDSGSAWSYVKKNLDSMMIASREAKSEK